LPGEGTVSNRIMGRHLVHNVWFIDPHRVGRRPAYVVEVLGVGSDRDTVLVTLNDDRPYGPWVASYGLDQELETCEPHTPITD